MDSQNKSFAARLNAQIIQKDTPLCVGLDPFAQYLPPLFGDKSKIASWESFFEEIIQIVADKVPVMKPQLGLFEPWGGAGIDLVATLCKSIKSKGALVILDAKRGDIGSTATGYADAYLGPNAAIECDCITLNPYLGIETLAPYISHAKVLNKGICVLVRTSNQGAKDFQDLDCNGAPLWVRIAEALEPIEHELAFEDTSSLMVVIGATWPNEAKRLREILPKAQFLIPGFGAQGGSAEAALAGFVNKGNRLEGGVVSSSRAILYPEGALDAKSLNEWRGIIKIALDSSIAELRNASEIVASS